MTITPRGLWEHNAYQTDNQFVIEVKPIVEDPNKLVQGTRGGYQGEKLSLNFQNVDVRRLLQVIGEFTGMNMVVSDSVGGSITLILKDVPWDQALDIIMQQKGLDMRKNGNVILIAPREEIATKEKLEFESQGADRRPRALADRELPDELHQGRSSAEAARRPQTDPALQARQRALDDRSNMMFVKDTPSRLDDVRAMIAKVDVPVRQVMIEARIVEAGDSFAKNLGIRLGWRQTFPDGAVRIGGDHAISGQSRFGSAGQSAGHAANRDRRDLSFILFNSALTQFLTAPKSRPSKPMGEAR
jgi:type IV pilus assembly protein PilQ